MAKDCVFCKIRDGEIPGDKLYSDDNCFVIRDIAPRAPTHLLVIPNEHFTFLTGLDDRRHAMLGGMFETAEKVAGQEWLSGGHRLVINQGDDAGQQVPHLHLHVLAGRALGAMG